MLTFNQIYSEVQNQTQDTDATSLTVIKRAINQGMQRFGEILNREWRIRERTFNTVASQQFYQMPEDAIRIKGITITVGNITYYLKEIADQEYWNMLNMRSQTSSIPQFYYVKGGDQFGIWPIPNTTTTTNPATLSFEPSLRDMTQDDYSTGTITVTNGSAAVVGSGTTFTQSMVGRTLFVDPTGGLGDGLGYKVAGYISATSISLENNYGGTTEASAAYLIGEVPDIPQAFHEALIDYAAYRYYRRRRDLGTAKDLKAAFDEALTICEQDYSSSTSSQYVRAPRPYSGFRQFKRDLTIP